MRLENITKTYHLKTGEKNTVFENFNVEFKTGVINALTGPSGCGKTTLLNIVAALVSPDEGRVVFEDSETGGLSYVFQKPLLFSWKTVLNNCLLVCKDKEKVLRILRIMELEDKIKRFPGQLSGGERQRTAFARALCYDFDVLLLDEPFQNLDYLLAERIAEKVFAFLQEEKKTVVWVSHKKELTDRYARKTISLPLS